MLTNKHVILALLVAPVLSLLAWFAVGNLVGEQPHAAVAGGVYPLLEKSNCRYPSGRCQMVNGDVSLTLRLLSPDSSPRLALNSSVELQGVLVAVVPPGAAAGDAPPPRAMASSDASGTHWQLSLPAVPPEGARLRLVAATSDNRFTAEVATRFARVDE
ncbi:hypothetical protein [Parahaliea mediterranea]|uniref:Uncharacterized protein n=1 Tax=Parahaliea mediterranea TaxID=651086 RepID=A0A939DFJ5_9GAMM|nr:hypothetical protein [Parahaliea mediterranea]MBN7796587.1 hypothetical protein [Parahaliea mediterranea]